MKKETISIATFDLEIDDSNPMENLNRVLEIVNSFEADLFLFPELFTTGYETEKWIELSKSSNEILKIL
jgi:predicted amidohydrolase